MKPKNVKIIFTSTPTSSENWVIKYYYKAKNDEINIEQNNVPIDLKMSIMNTIKNNLN